VIGRWCWLAALRPGGRLVTTISGTALILTADKTDDGGVTGRIEWDRAGFMHTRTGADYPVCWGRSCGSAPYAANYSTGY
jgi:hypothetical protein